MALRERLNDTVLAKAPAFTEHNASTPGAGVQCKPGSVMCVETYVVDSQVFWRCVLLVLLLLLLLLCGGRALLRRCPWGSLRAKKN